MSVLCDILEYRLKGNASEDYFLQGIGLALYKTSEETEGQGHIVFTDIHCSISLFFSISNDNASQSRYRFRVDSA